MMQAPFSTNQDFSRGIAGRRILKALRPMVSETTEFISPGQDNRRSKRNLQLVLDDSLSFSHDVDQPSKRVRQGQHEFPIEQGLATTPTTHNRSSQIGESSPLVAPSPRQLFQQTCDASTMSNQQPQQHAAPHYPPSLQAKINTRNKMAEKMEACQRRITELYTVMANHDSTVTESIGFSANHPMSPNKRRKPIPPSDDLQHNVVMAQQREKLVARLQYCQQYVAVLDMEINMELYGKYFHSL